MVELLKVLTETVGVSGDEGRVGQLIKQEVSSFVDEVYTDRIGNLIAYKKRQKGQQKGHAVCPYGRSGVYNNRYRRGRNVKIQDGWWDRSPCAGIQKSAGGGKGMSRGTGN